MIRLNAIYIQALKKMLHGIIGFGDEFLQGKTPPAFGATHVRFVAGPGNLKFPGAVRTRQGRLSLTGSKVHSCCLRKKRKKRPAQEVSQ